jgi:hypothetical protein
MCRIRCLPLSGTTHGFAVRATDAAAEAQAKISHVNTLAFFAKNLA